VTDDRDFLFISFDGDPGLICRYSRFIQQEAGLVLKDTRYTVIRIFSRYAKDHPLTPP